MTVSTLAQTLGRIPSGIFILSCCYRDQDMAMLASWVQQAGFAPPMLTVAMAKGRPLGEALSADRSFVLSIVGESQPALLRHFGRSYDSFTEMFEGITLERSEQGHPVLADALGHLECAPRASIDAGDHQVFAAEITSGHLRSEERPMIHVRKSGLHY